MFHVEHFYKNKNSIFRKRNKIKRKTNYCKINRLPLWNFAALFIGYLALKDFPHVFKQETKISLSQICKNLDNMFLAQKKRKTNSFIKYSNVLNNGLPYSEHSCRSN